jgi:hypothetical protein
MRIATYLAGLLLAAMFASTDAFSQSKIDSPMTHPLVGTWTVEFEIDLDGESEAIVSFFADGNVVATDSAGRTWQGPWASTGVQSGKFSLVLIQSRSGDRGITFFSTAVVDPNGIEFFRFTSPDSGGSKLHGIRISVDG